MSCMTSCYDEIGIVGTIFWVKNVRGEWPSMAVGKKEAKFLIDIFLVEIVKLAGTVDSLSGNVYVQ